MTTRLRTDSLACSLPSSDLLFFQRDVTKAPEETYHTWSFVRPLDVENEAEAELLASLES